LETRTRPPWREQRYRARQPVGKAKQGSSRAPVGDIASRLGVGGKHYHVRSPHRLMVLMIAIVCASVLETGQPVLPVIPIPHFQPSLKTLEQLLLSAKHSRLFQASIKRSWLACHGSEKAWRSGWAPIIPLGGTKSSTAGSVSTYFSRLRPPTFDQGCSLKIGFWSSCRRDV
jgi:hypothetical protein